MLFNSLPYLLFLPLVFILYWQMNRGPLKWQNMMLLAASYLFYATWDWRFLFLLMFSTLLDYVSGLQMAAARTQRARKAWFWASVIINAGFLGVFKYYNFFAESLADVLARAGLHPGLMLLNVVLPVGISFYTFHGLSYVIDIYKERIAPERNFVDYALFVSYFPLLVAGPIERATHLLPQIKRKRHFDRLQAIDGFQQMVWGFFKKVVIADTCALYANDIFSHYQQMNSLSLVMGVLYFTFQIYGDFSGYSDIALGTSKMLGISLLRNFDYPFFSRDIAEFWRRWHISLSSWFRDYLYIPLGGGKGGTWMKIRNVFIIFVVSGFWHGANWTFIIWGFLNALYILPLLIGKTHRLHLETVATGRAWPTFGEFCQMVLTFILTMLAFVIFRSPDIPSAIRYFKGMFAFDFHGGLQYLEINRYPIELLPMLLLFVLIEWHSRFHEHPFFGRLPKMKLALALAGIFAWGVFSRASDFIYFQF